MSRCLSRLVYRVTSLIILIFWLLLTMFFLPTPLGKAQDATFNTGQDFGDLNDTISLAVGDLNGDGFLDIVEGNYRQPHQIYFNDGVGNFLTPSPLGSTNNNTWDVIIGDLNGDGSLDIIEVNPNGLNYIYLNDGMGRFSTATPFGGANDTRDMALGDLNGDGFLDIVEGNWLQPDQIYFNDRVGGFLTPIPFGSINNTYSIIVGDLNGDGFLDIVEGNLNQPHNIYWNDGTGSFPTATPFGGINETRSLALGDLNGDSFLDIVEGNWAQPNQVYLNDRAGGFPTATPFGTANPTTWSVAVGDLNADGFLDIVQGNNGQKYVYLNDGMGNFPTAALFGGLYNTRSVVVGDLNGDGFLDIIEGNYVNQLNRIYLNNRVGGFPVASPFGGANAKRRSAVGDLNGDSFLDIVQANNGQSYLYLNDGVGNFPIATPFGSESNAVSVALGDLNGDSFLDIVQGNFNQPSQVYFNDGLGSFPTVVPFGSANSTWSVALGDLNSDGFLDIVQGNNGLSYIYLNDGAGNFPVVSPFGSTDNTLSVAVGDLNGDGFLDIVRGSSSSNSPSQIYLNDGLGGFPTATSFGSVSGTRSIAVGDLNGDSFLDIVQGKNGQSYLYLNDGEGNFPIAIPFGSANNTMGVAVGDLNGDGFLDIVQGNNFYQPNQVYLNDGAGRFPSATPIGNTNSTWYVALGDLNGDGFLDIVQSNFNQPNNVYLNHLRRATGLTNNASYLTVTRPITTGNADFYSSPVLLDSLTIPISYTLFDPEGDRVGRVAAFYSLDGGGNWRQAKPTSATVTTNLSTRPNGANYVYNWDTFASGFFGQSDNVVLRLVAYPQPPTSTVIGTYRYTNTVAGPYQWPYAAATTFPFRVRGTQVRVVNEAGQPMPGAIVYRLPTGQTQGGAPLGGAANPFRTDSQGFLQGRDRLNIDDRLLALAPLNWTDTLTWATGLTDTIHLYATNETDISGMPIFTVTQSGVQTLTVTSQHPLFLFDLHVSLEWDAHQDPVYLQQLGIDLQKASAALYDFTNGQVALGKVTVHQNADDWATSEVVVQASNRLRPFAVQGGIVLTRTVDISKGDIITYDLGQVTMGATWNRYGDAGQNLGDDWPLTLAHELSHYLLFLDDVYLGVNEAGLLIPVDTCTGSAMGDTYTPDNTEFLPKEEWLPKCEHTLAQRTLGRSEWETIKLWYPWLNTPPPDNAGPSLMPFDLTNVSILNPITPTNPLADEIFFADYANRRVASSEARAFLVRDDYILDLGSPTTGQNRIRARGAVADQGDRLCIFDLAKDLTANPPLLPHYGCKEIRSGDQRIGLQQDASWTPLIQLTPITSKTFTLQVANLPATTTFTLQARLFPEYGRGSSVIPLTNSDGVYSGTFDLQFPALAGHVQIWAANEAEPRHEVIVAYSIGGNPGNIDGPAKRGHGGDSRGGGPAKRGHGGDSRGGGAPLLSPDGQFIFFTENPDLFREGQFYIVQDMAGLPALPPGKKPIGPSYRLVASPGAPLNLAGSVSFQYLGIDALLEQVNENELTIHFWDEQTGLWQALPTVRSPYYNLASASSQGAGIYALLVGVTSPQILTVTPAIAVNNITNTLTLSGSDFLPPATVVLLGPGTSYTLPVLTVTPISITAVVTPGLAPAEYQIQVHNGDGGVSPQARFALFRPDPACFYDFFESGPSQWERSGEWNIVTIAPGGEQAMTDSPAGSYKNAGDYGSGLVSYTTAITSPAFSLADCLDPALTFRQDYLLAKLGDGEDVGQVAISTDNGQSWTPLASYSGGGIFDTATQQVESPEWANANWQNISIPLSTYTGTVRLRFSLTVNDDALASKGWLIDDIKVKTSAESPGPENKNIFLPVIVKGK